MRKNDLATTKQAGIQRKSSGTEQHDRGGNKRKRQRTRPVQEDTRRWSGGGSREHHEGKPGHGSGTGREEADQERRSAGNREHGNGPRGNARSLSLHQVRSTLDSRAYSNHQTKNQQAYPGPLTRERRKKSLQSAPLLDRRPHVYALGSVAPAQLERIPQSRKVVVPLLGDSWRSGQKTCAIRCEFLA